jgi:hypothetical protein
MCVKGAPEVQAWPLPAMGIKERGLQSWLWTLNTGSSEIRAGKVRYEYTYPVSLLWICTKKHVRRWTTQPHFEPTNRVTKRLQAWNEDGPCDMADSNWSWPHLGQEPGDIWVSNGADEHDVLRKVWVGALEGASHDQHWLQGSHACRRLVGGCSISCRYAAFTSQQSSKVQWVRVIASFMLPATTTLTAWLSCLPASPFMV